MGGGLVLILAIQLAVGVVHADPGFWSTDSIDIPPGVRSAGDSVYQIIVLVSAPRGQLGRADAEPALSEQRKRRAEDVQKPPTEAPTGNIGLLYQLRSCLERDRAQCDVHEVLAVGTAFVCRPHPNRVHVCTSYQNVAAAVQGGSGDEASAEQDPGPGERHVEIPIQLLLIDRQQRIVFDTRMESLSAVITGYAPRIDLALVQLSKTIGRPLAFYAPVDESDGDLQDYYIAGFPIVQRPETKREDYYAYPLNRYELSVTIGEIFQDPRHRRAGKEPEYIECDADSAPGMSGAPVLDGNGHVIGMLSRSMSNQVGSILVPAAAIQGYFSD
jgi:hypothetical protein